jgi:hypothetical protein
LIYDMRQNQSPGHPTIPPRLIGIDTPAILVEETEIPLEKNHREFGWNNRGDSGPQPCQVSRNQPLHYVLLRASFSRSKPRDGTPLNQNRANLLSSIPIMILVKVEWSHNHPNA